MQKLGRFEETKFNKVIFLCVWDILSVSIGKYVAELTATRKQIVPFLVYLGFDRVSAVGNLPSIHYNLVLQKKKGSPLAKTASMIFLDKGW